MTQTVTIFKDIKNTDTPFHIEVAKIIERIRDGKSKELVTQIRKKRISLNVTNSRRNYHRYALVVSFLNEQTTPYLSIVD